VASVGYSTSYVANYNRDSSLQSSAYVSTTSNGLAIYSGADIDGDGNVDLTSSDVTVVGANGSRTQTVEARNADNSLRAKDVIIKGGDGRSRDIQSDTDGDGVVDRTETIVVDPVTPVWTDSGEAGYFTNVTLVGTVATVSTFADDGTRLSMLVSTTTNGGLSRANQYDVNGDGSFETTISDVTVVNANGSATTTHSVNNASTTLRNQAVQTVSANGLITTTNLDFNGDAVFDVATTDTTQLRADGSKYRTVVERNADASLLARSTVLTSIDRQVVTTKHDLNGDEFYEWVLTATTEADGDLLEYIWHKSSDGGQISKSIVTTSADGFERSSQLHFNADTIADLKISEITVLNLDGSRTTTVTETNANNSLRDKTT
jgi:hypothetical protein